MFEFQCIIIGAGPGGYVAALRAAQRGMTVALIEAREAGGTCLNRGCIPTKALLHVAHLHHSLQNAIELGLETGPVRANWEALHAYKDRIVTTQRESLEALLQSHGVQRIHGRAKVTAPHTVEINGQTTLTADHILIATGSEPTRPPIPGIDLPGVVTSDTLLETADHPLQSLVIIGGGVIGVEFAAFYAQLGAAVTVIEAQDRLLPLMDDDLGKFAQQTLKRLKVQVLTSAKVDAIRPTDSALEVQTQQKRKTSTATGERVLVATGRRPNLEPLFSPSMRPAQNGPFLKVDAHFQTSIDHIWAIGDVIGGMQLAHEAEAEARHVIAHILGTSPQPDLRYIPACVYLPTEVASLGLSEPAALEQAIPYGVTRVPVTSNARMQIEGLGRGFIKLLYDPQTRRLLGIHLACGRASDLIAAYAIHLHQGLTVDELLTGVLPHPSFAESLTDALESILD